LLAGRTDRAVHLESDGFFHFIASGYVEPWKAESHAQNTVVMQIVGDVAVSYARAGYSVIIDGIVLPGWFFDPLRDSISAAGFPWRTRSSAHRSPSPLNGPRVVLQAVCRMRR
jgi:hypothetical protein